MVTYSHDLTNTQIDELKDRIRSAISKCTGCQAHGPAPMKPGAVHHAELGFSEDVRFDLVQLRSTIWALSILDRGTK